MRSKFHILALVACLLAVSLAGCFVPGCAPIAASTQPATTQISLAAVATQATNDLDDAVNLIHAGLSLGLITKAEYNQYIAPAIPLAKGYIATMTTAATNNDLVSFQTAENLYNNVIATIHTYSSRTSAAKGKPAPATKPAS